MQKGIYIIFIILGKATSFVTKLFGRGEGTALPGLLAEKYAPAGMLGFFFDQIPQKIVITGTNGKTSTQKILGEIFKEAELEILRNDSGSNMKRGMLSKLIAESTLSGRIHEDVMILETEEATLPRLISTIKPQIIIVTNLFRDQLDAYGELDRTQKFIREAVDQSPESKLILNGDDPLVTPIAEGVPNQVIYFGLEESARENFAYEGVINNEELEIKNKSRINTAENLKVNQDLSTTFNLSQRHYTLNIPGIYHVYNALAAILAAKELDIKDEHLASALNKVEPAFGRGERIKKDEINYSLLLVKNPAGMNLTLQQLKLLDKPNLVFILNDQIADGRDVSWIWDAEFEILKEICPSSIVVSGERASDLLVRIKYTLGELEKTDQNEYLQKETGIKVYIKPQVQELHTFIKEKYPKNSSVYVLPTYTAMLKFRKSLLGTAIYG